MEALLDLGIQFNACSLKQLETFGKIKKGGKVGVRFNPGSGSGGNNRTNVGGVSSSFGIWHGLVAEVKALCAEYDLEVVRIHTCLLYTSPSPRDRSLSRMPSSA